MEIASYQIDVAGAAAFVTPMVLLLAAAIWLLVATGVVGRIAMFFEELPHRAAAEVVATGRPTGAGLNDR